MSRYKIDDKEKIQFYTSKQHKELMKEVADKENTTVTEILKRAFNEYYKKNYEK